MLFKFLPQMLRHVLFSYLNCSKTKGVYEWIGESQEILSFAGSL